MKPISNTTISFGLVNVPVGVCKATEDRKVQLDSAAPDGSKLKQVFLNAETGEEVARDDILKGVRGEDGTFKAISAVDLAAIDEQCKLDTMEITDTITLKEFYADYACRITGKYFLQSPSKGGSPKAYKLLHEALKSGKMAAVTKWTARTVQQQAVIYAADGALVMNTLSFTADMREPDKAVLAPQGQQITKAEIEMAKNLLSAMTGRGSLDTDDNEAIPLKAKLVEEAISGKGVKMPKAREAAKQESVDLMATLAESLKVAKAA